MKSRVVSMGAVALVAFVLGSQAPFQPSIGQEETAPAKAAPAKTVKKPRGRLPAYYGQVGISSAQRTKIYSLQAQFGKQISDLQKQIDDLEGKRDSEVLAVLTPEQQKKLDELQTAAKKAAEERRNRKKSS